MQKLVKSFDDVREKYFESERRTAKLVRIICRQERINAELKSFIVDCLEDIFHKVEQKRPEIVAEIIRRLPTDVQYSKHEKENPFAMYCSYLDYVRPIELEEKANAEKEELVQLNMQLEAQEVEFESCKNVCDMYLEKEAEYKSEIDELKRQNAELQKRLRDETGKLQERYQ